MKCIKGAYPHLKSAFLPILHLLSPSLLCLSKMASFSKSGLYWSCTPSLDLAKPTLVFLHAAWMSSTMFDETLGHLSAKLPNTNLLCIDLNGHGRTTMGRKNFTLWDQGEDVVALMVVSSPSYSVGHSALILIYRST